MNSAGGAWVEVPRPDGTTRRDWRPDEQPPSPDGSPGCWHVVTGDGQPDRWEWIGAASGAVARAATIAPRTVGGASAVLAAPGAATLAAPAGDARARGSLPRPKKTAVVGALVAVAVLAGAAVVIGLGGGGAASGSLPTTLGPGQTSNEQIAGEIAVAFDQFQVVDDGTGGQRGLVQVQFVNNGVESRSFDVRVRAVDGQGAAVEDLTRVDNLEPGQSVVKNMFGTLAADRFAAMAAATFGVAGIVSVPTGPQ
ncbi:MAG: hypothetical protein ACT4QG_17830 [Sporichthyaceae bacterium]